MNQVFFFRLVAVCFLFVVVRSFSGTALYLDGDNDYVKLFEPIIKNKLVTIEVWGKMHAPGGGVYQENCLFEQRNSETGFGAATFTILSKNSYDDQASFELRDSNSGRIKLFSQIEPYNEWHHYTGVIDSTVIRFYIDGVLVDSNEFEFSGSFDVDVSKIDIGRHAYLDIVAGYFNGMIDEMRIWNYAKSNQEIVAGMEGVVDLEDQATMDKLLAYWRFDDFYEFWKNDQQYVGVKDLSGNEHHGAFIDDATLIDADYEPKVLQLRPFSLLAPENGILLEDSYVHLEWQAATTDDIIVASEMRYDIWMSNDPDFQNSIVETVFGRTHLDIDLEWGQIYYWKVQAQNSANEQQWSTEYFTFTIGQASRDIPLQSFHLTSPANDASIYTTAPHLLWQKATWIEAVKEHELTYTIYLDESPGFENAMEIQTYGEVNYTQVFDLQKGHSYFWKVKAENYFGDFTWSENIGVFHVHIDATVDDFSVLPQKFALHQNYPNPFNPATRISFDLPVEAYITLKVFDVDGRLVKVLVDSPLPPGAHCVRWDGTTDAGSAAAAGVYFYTFVLASEKNEPIHLVKKMTFLK